MKYLRKIINMEINGYSKITDYSETFELTSLLRTKG